jgi:hypothetical protein
MKAALEAMIASARGCLRYYNCVHWEIVSPVVSNVHPLNQAFLEANLAIQFGRFVRLAASATRQSTYRVGGAVDGDVNGQVAYGN